MAETSKGDILKVRLGNDTRRLVLYNTHISYDDLVLMLQRIFNGQLKSSDDVTLKYYDDDGDLITIADATDFAHAREYSSNGVVKMVIFVNGSDNRATINAHNIRKELAIVRDRINNLVDTLDAVTLKDEQITGDTGHTDHASNIVVTESSTNSTAIYTAVTEAISVFDPLKPSSDYSSVVTTTASSATQLPTTTTNFIPVTSTGSTSHLFAGQASSFFEPPSSGPQYNVAQPTAPPPSSTPQPSQPNPYSSPQAANVGPPPPQASNVGPPPPQASNIGPPPPQASNVGPPPQAGGTGNTYTGGGNPSYPYNSQYQQQPTASSSSHYQPQPQPSPVPPTASYSPYPPASMYQGNTYPPQGQPPPAGRGTYPPGPPRNSPYRIGY